MKIPLKHKYRVPKPAGTNRAGSSNSTPKPKSVAAQLYATWKRRGGK
jgi:hypothetical protein